MTEDFVEIVAYDQKKEEKKHEDAEEAEEAEEAEMEEAQENEKKHIESVGEFLASDTNMKIESPWNQLPKQDYK